MQHSAPITRRQRSRLHRAAALALAAIITAAGLTSAATTPSGAADQVPWACTGEGWILQNGPTEAYTLDLASGVASRVATSDEPSNLNAVGYNEADGMLWGALREASPVIASMGSNGVTKRYGTPIGIGSKYDGPAWVIGDVDDAQQLWMLGLVDEAYVVMVVDVDRTSSTFMHSLADVYDVPVPAGTFNISDWAYEPYTGLVWALVRMADGTTAAMSLDPSNIEQGLVARHEDLAMTYGTYGAMYADGEGNVYGGQNATGEIWRVNVITGATTLVATGPTSSQNDGARCTVPLTTDFGDAPDSYGTTVRADGARHSITGYDPESFTADYTLGDLVDADGDDALPGIKADGDDVHGAADEDALTMPLEYPVDGSPLTIDFPVQVRGDEPATVAAWFDTDSSGSFVNDSDRVTTTISHSGTVSLTLPPYAPPAGEDPTDTYLRLRIFAGDIDDPQPTGAVLGGEVEDYLVTPARDTASLEASMRIVDDVASAAPGETVTVETTLTNTGENSLWHRSAIIDVTGALDDATMGMVSASRGTADYEEDAQQIVWRGALAAGESAMIRHELVVGANYVGDQDVASRVAGADVVNCSGDDASCGAAFAVSFGSLEVTHSSTGDAAGASWLPAAVEAEVMCVSPDESHSVSRPVTLAVDGGSSVAAGLPLGYACTVVPDAVIAGTSTVTPSTAVVGVEPEVTVVTDFDSAGVDVRVGVDGNAASTSRVPAEVVVDVVCRHTDAGVLVDQAVTVVPGGAGYTFAGLPFGTSCEGTVGDYGQDSTDLSGASVSLDTSAPVQLVAFLTYAQGSLTVQSSTQGEGAGETWVPDSITAQVVCTHPADGVVVDQILTVPADGARTIDGIRVGSVCDVTGQADEADEISLVDAQTITAGGTTVELASVYSANALRVTTAVVGSGAGEAWVPDAFTTSVVCSRDGLGEVYSRDLVQAAGESFTIAGLPLGARCAVHQDDAGADALTYGPSDSVEVRGTSSVTVRNTFKAGALDVAAAVRGTAAAEAWVPSQFVLEATCSHPDYGTFIDGTVSVGSGAAARAAGGLPMGTECEVSTVAEPLAAAVSLDAQSVTITREAPSVVTAAYTFSKNTLRVTQSTAGSGARTAWAPSTFSTTVKCSTDSGPVGVKTFTAAAGTSHAVTGLPTGASCEISQPEAGADALTFAPASLLEVRGDTRVEISARFDAGKVRLSAAVEGPAAGEAWVPSKFPVDVTCRSDRFGEVLDETLTPSVATAALSSGLPVDTSCALHTGDYRQARTSTTADVIEISDTSVVDVAISSAYEAGELLLDTTSVGNARLASWAPTTVDVAAQCTAPWGDDVGTLEETAAVDGATAALEGLPVGSTCGVDVHGDDLAQVSASRSTIVVSEPAAAEVAVVTSVKGADLRIRRAVTGDVAQAWEREAVTATCTAAGREIFAAGFDQDKPMRFLLAVDEEVSAQLLPIGSECLVTDASGITVLATISERGGDADFASYIPFAGDEPSAPEPTRALSTTGAGPWRWGLIVAGAVFAVDLTFVIARRHD